MKLTPVLVAGAVVASAFLNTVPSSAADQATSSSATLARGKYLVESVGLCSDCHSPRNPDGSFDMTRWLGGAPVAFTPAFPMPEWANVAPPIAGLPGYTDEQALTFLQTGVTATSTHPRPPMPPYRFSREDAEAVLAYLRSLAN